MSYSSGTLNRDSAGALGAGTPTSGGSILVDGASREQASSTGSSRTMDRVVANDGTGTTDWRRQAVTDGSGWNNATATGRAARGRQLAAALRESR